MPILTRGGPGRRFRQRAPWRTPAAHSRWTGGSGPPGRTDGSSSSGHPPPPDAGLEWPYWLIMLAPWIGWLALVMLQRLDICAICLVR